MSETVFDLIVRPEDVQTKPQMYRSKYPGNLPPTLSTFGNVVTSNVCGATNAGGNINFECARSHTRPGATFGPANGVLPKQIPKPSKGTTNLPKPAPFKRNIEAKHPPVPKANETSVVSGLEPVTNFVVKNAIKNILMETGERAPDRRKEIFKHENFGKIPAYLIENKDIVEEEKRAVENRMLAEQKELRDGGMYVLPEQQRIELLQRMKEEWAKTNTDYQGMTHLINLDTIGKVRRKERYEKTLQEVEQNIAVLSKPVVMIREQ